MLNLQVNESVLTSGALRVEENHFGERETSSIGREVEIMCSKEAFTELTDINKCGEMMHAVVPIAFLSVVFFN